MSTESEPLFPQLKYCIRCCLPETEEGTSFDEVGICRVCQSSEQKMHIDWRARERALREIFDRAKAQAGDNYDCLLPISGGKDSMFQAHVLTKVYGMKPLAVTFNHNWYSETGWYNLMNLLETFNLDHIMFTPNRGLVNRLAKKSISAIGDTCWHCHSGCGAFPLQVAARFGIPLLIYGESVAENSGRATYLEPIKYDREYFTRVSAKKSPDDMVCEYISRRDVHPFQLPSAQECEERGVFGIHLGDYMFWDSERQMEFVRDTYGWRETEIEGSYKHYKSAECVMPGMHDFTCYLKRGFARGTLEGSIDVRAGLLSRAEAFKLVRQRDPIRPEALDYFLEVTGLSEAEFFEIMAAQQMGPLKGQKLPVHPKPRPNAERIRPFPVQLVERLRRIPGWERPTEGSVESALAPDGAVTPDIFLRFSIRRIVEGYRTGKFSPLEVARACIAQVEKLDPTFQALESFDPELLLTAAAQSQARLEAGQPPRPLEGIPCGVKDVYNTQDLPTQMGSVQWKDFTPGNDARVVFNLKQAGGLVAAKTATAEFAVHALGNTINPHHPAHTPGTSSSGSAVASVLGLFPLNLGTQTGASISRPASFCGAYGFKPSFGLLPRTGTLKTTDSLDTLGFLTTHLEDIPLVFETLRVRGEDYPISHAAMNDRQRQAKPTGRPWRVALFRTHAWEQAPDYARDALLQWAQRLAASGLAEIVEPAWPAIMERAHQVHVNIYDFALSYYFKNEAMNQRELSPIMAECVARGRGISNEQYRQALKDQEKVIATMEGIMSGVDVGLSLSTAGQAPLREVMETPDPSLIWTLAHLPALSAPLFVSPTGLPFGAQFIARKYNDSLLLRFMGELLEYGLVPPGPNPMPAVLSVA